MPGASTPVRERTVHLKNDLQAVVEGRIVPAKKLSLTVVRTIPERQFQVSKKSGAR